MELKSKKIRCHMRHVQHKFTAAASESSSAEEFVELLVGDINVLYGLWSNFPFIYKIGEQQPGAGPELLQQVCRERGWKEYSQLNIDSYGNCLEGWNLHWVTGKLSSKNIYNWQISNHSNFYCNGNNYSFTMKNGCSRYLKRLQNSFGSTFDFGPLTFNLPSDYARLCSEHAKRRKIFLTKLFTWEFETSLRQQLPVCEQQPPECYSKNCVQEPPKDVVRPIWICKPVGKSRGRGIFVFDSPEKLNYMKHCVVQEYITRPYLIGGYKWDLRLYVCIVCRDPLVIYTYSEGLVRFGTSKFNLNHLSNVYSHLTNTSVNRESPEYMQVKTEVGKGCKWPLRKLRSYWKAHNINDWYLWQRIWKVIILTIVADTSNICKSESFGRHFDLLGFDIIVDENLKPYLLEVNTNPALSLDCEVDEIVKRPMLHDLFDLLGLPDVSHFQDGHNTAYSEEYSNLHCDDNNSLEESCSVNSVFEENSDAFCSTSPGRRSPTSTLIDIVDLHNNLIHRKHKVWPSLKFQSEAKSPSPSLISNNFSLAHLHGAQNAYNEIMGLAGKPGLRTKRSPVISESFLSGESIDYESTTLLVKQEMFPNHGSTSTIYKENPYFQTFGVPGQVQIHPPIHVKIPIKKRPCRIKHPKNYLDKWRTGLLYKLRDWTRSHCSNNDAKGAPCPEKVGGWIRSYPFDHTTASLSCNSINFDIRTAIQHVNNYMKVARDVSLAKSGREQKRGHNWSNGVNSEYCNSDYYYDQNLSKRMQLNTKVWHPENPQLPSAASPFHHPSATIN